MPVYLCQSGSGQTDPWRYGIQVYATPFPILQDGQQNEETAQRQQPSAADSSSNPASPHGSGRDLVVATWMPQSSQGGQDAAASNTGPRPPSSSSMAAAVAGHPIRRVRHAEIVLVDDVCVAYDRYWLRLRWPGHKGGFAGYIAMGLVSETPLPGKGKKNLQSLTLYPLRVLSTTVLTAVPTCL